LVCLFLRQSSGSRWQRRLLEQKGLFWLAVRILDEGPGIRAYALNKIFDRFYSLPRPVTGKRSSGLGLCFAREVAHLHHGSVKVQNRKDRNGAEAVLILAAAEPMR
jgi:two-component system sensor histidine kinase CreC